MDEVAFWTRALTDDEAYALYMRGATPLVRARSCDNADCSDASFVGSDNTADTFLASTFNGDGTQTLDVSHLSARRYFQYKVINNDRDIYYNAFPVSSFSVLPSNYNVGSPSIDTASAIAFKSVTSIVVTADSAVRWLVSNDGGSSWLNFAGGSWQSTTAAAESGTTTSVLTSNAASIPVGSGQLKLRAYLVSDGTSDVSFSGLQVKVSN